MGGLLLALTLPKREAPLSMEPIEKAGGRSNAALRLEILGGISQKGF
jgi:hypothetical protein